MSGEPESQIAREPRIVTGVVHPRGSSGVMFKSSQLWTLRFAFETWRAVDGTVHHSQLDVSRQVKDDELRAYMDRIHPYRILSARVVFTGPASAELIELLDQSVNIDEQLAQRAAELLKPQTREHERFGTLIFNRRVDWYEVTTPWAGWNIKLNLDAADDTELEAAFRTAGELWDDQAGWNQRIEAYAVQQLLDLKNDTWLDDDEDGVTPEQFKSRMKLDSITVSPDGGFEFWHDDGDLFFGHSILVTGNLRDGPTEADIPG